MFVAKEPYYRENKDWFYLDPRKGRYRLTDKATPKAIESFIDNYAHYTYDLFILPNAVEIATEWAKEDIKDFKENKSRYTFERNGHGILNLVAVDGKKISQ